MDEFLVIRCEGKDDIAALIELLKAELSERDWYFRLGDAGDNYYTAADVAGDTSRVTVIDTTTPMPEDDE